MSKPIVANASAVKVHMEAGKAYFFCTCGRSAKQPFCDGKHAETDLQPMRFQAEKTGPAYLCRCKQSKRLPYCDGSHTRLPPDAVGCEYEG